jgi:hypothetical protein
MNTFTLLPFAARIEEKLTPPTKWLATQRFQALIWE